MWEVIGQERAVSLLEHGLKASRLSHAYLFVGPAHVGKMTLARNLAQALNCESDEKPCLQCPSCLKIRTGTHSDVQVIGITMNEEDSESKNISTEQIKDMQHAASLPPFEGKHKVFIIDGAELMSIDAANRFLKTLEEPESNVTFLLLTTNDRLLPETVVSRCQKLELQPLSIAEETAALEKRGIGTEKARLLSGLSHGCPGWAILAAEDESFAERHGEFLNMIIRIINADAEERFAYAAKLAAGFTQNRGAVYDVLAGWLDFWRDLMLVKTGCPEMMTNSDRKDDIIKIAGRYSLVKIKDFIKSIEAAAEQLRQNVNTRLALEVLMLDIPREEVASIK